ncbi:MULTISPECIES: sensor histidine kinase [unclassified Microbacterium]|uniref:sensor histidine kinase n=1 Tax=unclassified Microbacterium TaxID=2609290 RepID=UPI00301A5D28
MRVQRIALVVGLLLALAAVGPAADVRAAADGSPPVLPVIVLVVTVALALVAVATIIPAWRGSRRAAVLASSVPLVGSLTALPAFFAPADVLPPSGVALASVQVIVAGAVFVGVLLPISTVTLQAATAVFALAVFGLLTAVSDAVLPAGAQRAAQTVAAVAIAIGYAPGLRLLRRTVGRALFGGRIDPSGTARTVGEHLRTTDTADQTPADVVEEVRAALRLPRLSLRDRGGLIAASASPRAQDGVTDGAVTESLIVDAAHDAVLDVALRPGELRLSREDRAALELLLPSLALLLRTRRLAAGLARARAATVEARERERSGLHRELHDGLGPVLTGALYRADAARRQLVDDPDAAAATLDAAREELRAAVDGVRRVAYGLRPIELEEHGLWGALARQAGARGRLTVAVDLPGDPPELTPAVELAAFRVAAEAIANAARHSSGTLVEVSVRVTSDGLAVRIHDDGSPPPRWSEGIGLASLRDRVTELRGRVDAGPRADGWRVDAWLPLS